MPIRPLNTDDLDAVMAIETLAFSTPNTRSAYARELTSGHARLMGTTANGDNTNIIVGYINYWILQNECHLHTLAIHPKYRRTHLADALIAHMFAESRQSSCVEAFLELRPSNHAAMALYRKHGFLEVGRRPNYYADNREEAILMNKSLAST